jgi:hypothetical protein
MALAISPTGAITAARVYADPASSGRPDAEAHTRRARAPGLASGTKWTGGTGLGRLRRPGDPHRSQEGRTGQLQSPSARDAHPSQPDRQRVEGACVARGFLPRRRHRAAEFFGGHETTSLSAFAPDSPSPRPSGGAWQIYLTGATPRRKAPFLSTYQVVLLIRGLTRATRIASQGLDRVR